MRIIMAHQTGFRQWCGPQGSHTAPDRLADLRDDADVEER